MFCTLSYYKIRLTDDFDYKNAMEMIFTIKVYWSMIFTLKMHWKWFLLLKFIGIFTIEIYYEKCM